MTMPKSENIRQHWAAEQYRLMAEMKIVTGPRAESRAWGWIEGIALAGAIGGAVMGLFVWLG